jgi:hypothetical protein
MTLIEAKQRTERQTTMVPGTGGEPLAEKFEGQGTAPADTSR